MPQKTDHFRDLNPYAPPRINGCNAPLYAPTEFVVVLDSRSWLYRRLLVSGPSPCVVEYNGRGPGYETVLVNGEVATRATSGGLHLASPIDFELPGCPRFAARLEIKTACLLFLAGLRFSIENCVVYQEGKW